jgi:hypothetical protein
LTFLKLLGTRSAPIRAGRDGYCIGDFVVEDGMTFGNNVDLHGSRWKPDVGTMVSDFMAVPRRAAECLMGTPLELSQIG